MANQSKNKSRQQNPHGSGSAASKPASKKTSASSAVNKKSHTKTIVIAIVCAAVIGGLWYRLSAKGSQDLQTGLNYLEAQESKTIDELEQTLSQKRRSRMMAAIESGKSSIFSLFQDSLIFGDSRVYGFGSYSFVPNDQVLAEAGATILNITDYLDVVKNVQPEKIYLSYGVNDMGLQIGSDRGDNGYRQVYEEQIDKLLEVSPHSQIIVNSILDATPARVEESPRWGHVAEYNEQIKQMCEDRGWTYVDNSELTQNGNADIYQPDGVHLQSNFYPLWAQNMILAATN
ncbi:SGNH/GDSL hydrolase family protein [Allobaculum mucilyticum]|uniref:SGNH/GDSL hydrolase family protein n=1 Tax=Allobaculum mucilyticum TaxID=2834459 RepID=UPI001E2B905B|nr:GDSL-type esterase/lipase family protein [Allobaculum mucilyticum]UNT96893.1 hypothetical protein KWG62_03840 [Allobaculum mucilyticum]